MYSASTLAFCCIHNRHCRFWNADSDSKSWILFLPSDSFDFNCATEKKYGQADLCFSAVYSAFPISADWDILKLYRDAPVW